jgi:hypothetical protein
LGIDGILIFKTNFVSLFSVKHFENRRDSGGKSCNFELKTEGVKYRTKP